MGHPNASRANNRKHCARARMCMRPCLRVHTSIVLLLNVVYPPTPSSSLLLLLLLPLLLFIVIIILRVARCCCCPALVPAAKPPMIEQEPGSRHTNAAAIRCALAQLLADTGKLEEANDQVQP